jgi:hypothetical protein
MKTLDRFMDEIRAKGGGKRRLYIEGLHILGLTERQALALILCYCEGNSTSQVAQWWRCHPGAIESLIRRASKSLVKRGLPCPKPYGRGSRAELRAAFPGLVDMQRE